jgi:hypothetical protein
MTKIDPQQKPKKKVKNGAGTGGENRGAEGSQGAFMTRSREGSNCEIFEQK